MRPSQSPGGRQFSADDHRRVERALATARLLLAVALLPPAFTEPGPTLFVQLAAGGYLLFAGLILFLLHVTVTPGRVFTGIVHGIDMGAAAAVVIVSDAGSASIVMAAFALVAASQRWGFIETIGTTAAIVAVPLAQIIVVPLVAGTIDAGTADVAAVDRLVTHAAYFVIGGVVLGYLAQTNKQARIEASIVAHVTSRLDLRIGLTHTIAAVLDALLRLVGATRAVLVVHETASGRAARWDGSRLTNTAAPEPVLRGQEDPSAVATFLCLPPGSGVHVIRRGSAGERLDSVWVEPDGTPRRSAPAPLPDVLIAALGPFKEMISVSVEMPEEWTGRVFLIDPRVSRDRSGAVAFAQRVVQRLVPLVYNVYLLRRMRGRSVADERARMARELHDGMVQSILGVQVQLHALAVHASGVRRELAADLNRLAMTLREEVLRLREMMQRMKQISPNPEQLVDGISAIVRRFETETGIQTRFITRTERVPLLPPACLELTRIVQEALVNVRRHSGARRVFIRFAVEGEMCRLSVDDDGRGYPFAGRLSLEELDRGHYGPWVIKERVKRLGGDIIVESVPGRGSRLEISFPVSKYALQG